jgi:hypothetical protein
MRPKRSAFVVAERQGRREVGPIAIDRLLTVWMSRISFSFSLIFFALITGPMRLFPSMLTSRIVTTRSGHIALQHLLTIYRFQAIALVLRKAAPPGVI